MTPSFLVISHAFKSLKFMHMRVFKIGIRISSTVLPVGTRISYLNERKIQATSSDY